MRIAIDSQNKMPSSVDWEAFMTDAKQRGYTFRPLDEETLQRLEDQSARKRR